MKLSLMWDRMGEAPAGWARHIPVRWGDIEGAAGQYGFARVEGWLASNPAPAFLAFEFSVGDEHTGELTDLTPDFRKRSLTLQVGAHRGEVPNYANFAWRDALYAAVEALAVQFRNDDRVEAFFWGPGLDDEINAVVDWPGYPWSGALRNVLKAEDYYNFVVASTAMAVEVWRPKPVYLAAASAPGTPWGQRRKDVTLEALASGAGYRCNGLLEDRDNAVGLGRHAGTGMFEMCQAATFCAFEGGVPGTGQPDGRLYWMLLQALHWGAQHANLQRTWLEAAKRIQPLLPGERWIVFRDAEFAPQTWTAGGVLYGMSGVPGAFGCGLWLPDGRWPAQPVFRSASFGYDRWTLTAERPFELGTDLGDGRFEVEIWRPSGCRERLVVDVAGGRMVLPEGAYHRIDVVGAVAPPPALSLEERVRRLEVLHGL